MLIRKRQRNMLRNPTCRCEDNTKMNLRDFGCFVMAQHSLQEQIPGKSTMNVRVLQKR
jgi:predicted nucleic acid-binding Zn ribbon protein